MPTPAENAKDQRDLMALGLSKADALEVLELRSRIVHQSTPVDYPTLKDKIRAEKKFRTDRYAAFARLYEIAQAAGQAAGQDHRPEPMVVKDMQTGYVYPPVMDGVCGFAWVTVRPANSSFALWAKKERGWSKAYGGGMQLWVSAFGQSYERKMAYARGFAKILNQAGLDAIPGGRLD